MEKEEWGQRSREMASLLFSKTDYALARLLPIIKDKGQALGSPENPPFLSVSGLDVNSSTQRASTDMKVSNGFLLIRRIPQH
jgi:hypothetical protein